MNKEELGKNDSIEEQVDVVVNKYMNDKKIFEDIPGYNTIFWNLKKKILKEKYNIDWQTPEELEPDVIFD